MIDQNGALHDFGLSIPSYSLYPTKQASISQTLLGKLKGLVFGQSNPTQENAESQNRLYKKINDLENSAHDVFTKLFSLRKTLHHILDVRLLNSVNAVIDPLIKDMGRLKDIKVPGNKSLEEQNGKVDQYQNWLNSKVRPWVQLLENHAHDRAAVIKAIVKFTIQSSNDLVDRDLQVIHEYLNHRVVDLKLSPEEHQKLSIMLQNVLSTPLQRLDGLRQSPCELSLEQLNIWKTGIDHERTEYCNEALDTIDRIIHQIYPQAEMHSESVDVEL